MKIIIRSVFLASIASVCFCDLDSALKWIPSVKSKDCTDQKAISYACNILHLSENGSITLWNRHPSGVKDNATALDNIKDACNGKAASRSKYTCKECPKPGAPGGKVCLHAILLEYIFDVASELGYIHVNEIAGACHSCKSKHYLGRAVDIDPTKNKSKTKKMVDMCFYMGGWAQDEKTHVHCQFNTNSTRLMLRPRSSATQVFSRTAYCLAFTCMYFLLISSYL